MTRERAAAPGATGGGDEMFPTQMDELIAARQEQVRRLAAGSRRARLATGTGSRRVRWLPAPRGAGR